MNSVLLFNSVLLGMFIYNRQVVFLGLLAAAVYLLCCGVRLCTLRRSGPVHSDAETHRLSSSTNWILFSQFHSCFCLNKQSSSTRILLLRGTSLPDISFLDKHSRAIQGNSQGKYRTLNPVTPTAGSVCSARLCLWVYNRWFEEHKM